MLTALRTAFPEIKQPTTIQKHMLALLNSDLSVLVRSASGTGKSLATALFLLSFVGKAFKNTGPSISHLLLVPTPDLAVQYYQTFQSLLKDSPLNIDKVVQNVYRCDARTEAHQISLLTANPGPRILIGTPTRILDILASPELRHSLPFHNLSCIALDEVDHLLPFKESFFNTKSLKFTMREDHEATKVPAQILLNHIVPWRNTHIKTHNEYFTPLRFIFGSSTASNYAKLLAMRHNWITGRPMLRLGLDRGDSGAGTGEFPKRLPRDVSNYFVTYDTAFNMLHDTKLAKLDKAVVRDSKFQEAVRGINERRKKEALKSATFMSPKHKTDLMNKYVDALSALLKSDESRKRALVIVPDLFSISTLLNVLKERGNILGGTSRFSDTENGAVFTDSRGKVLSVDTKTLFLNSHQESKIEPESGLEIEPEIEVGAKTPEKESTGTADPELPQVLLYRGKGVVGLDFPGLSRIYALGWDSILSAKLYVSLAGRCRAAPIVERGIIGTGSNAHGNGQWKPSSDPDQGRIVVVTLAEEAEKEGEELALRLAASMAKINAMAQQYCK